jgi:xylan 1,4-beta-xylosidase
MRPRALALAALVSLSLSSPHDDDRVGIYVNANPADAIGPMTPVWAMFGYDEPNYTYTENGRKLLSELAELSPVPVYVRAHNLLTTGDGTPALKWGSTNAYTEDADGRPRYDWTIVDRIFDTYVQRKMKPLVEIGFMPEALSTHPQPYKHDWRPGTNAPLYTGWSYPPKDYDRWRDLVSEWARHSIQRYGRAEVESWYWEVWNEPDIGYWHGTPEEYLRLYDYAADGLKRVLPSARIGGPTVTGPNGERTQKFLRDFLEHCARGTNAATGRTGAPLDYISFHAKGAPRIVDGHVRMGLSNQLRAIDNGFSIVASFPEFKQTPIIIGESDPEGCAACGVATNPENAYRNGTMYSSYTAEQLARTYQLAFRHGVNLRGALTWAFEFEDQPYFAGFRDLATNGIDKPVLNVFRMFGEMRGKGMPVQMLPTQERADTRLDAIRDQGVRGAPDVSALATRADRSVDILVWNYHDDDLPAPDAAIDVTIGGLTVSSMNVTHERVDADHSNAYEAWKRLGSPQPPSPAQYRALEAAGRLQRLEPPRRLEVRNGLAHLSFALPRQGVSLVRLSW